MITIWTPFVSDRFAESVTLTAKLNVPEVVGVPAITPLGANVSPLGSDPALTAQVNGGVPPVAVKLC